MKTTKKILTFLLSSCAVIPCFSTHANPHSLIPAQDLVANDTYLARYMDENGMIPLTMRIHANKYLDYPVVINLQVFPYIPQLHASHYYKPFDAILRLQPNYSVPEGIPKELEDKYLSLDGRDLPQEAFDRFRALGIRFIPVQNECMFWENDTYGVEIDPEYRYERKLTLENAANAYLETVVAGMLAE
jgi:hypothetical protein